MNRRSLCDFEGAIFMDEKLAELLLPFDMDKPMGQVRQLDKRMNDAGLLRLMVSDPLAMNMSNTLGYLRGELKAQNTKRKAGLGKRLLEVGFIKKMLLSVYNRIFKIYYE